MKRQDLLREPYRDIDVSFENIHDADNAQIKNIKLLEVKGHLNYIESLDAVSIDAKIHYIIEAIDARDGKDIEVEDQLDWEDQYAFVSNEVNDGMNLIIGDSFEILDYSVEQIVLNIPMNLTQNYDKISFVGKSWKLLSEDEYNEELENQVDPRWEKLKDLDFGNKN